jgi:putative toxin-antitoxin system antitoxin component (TIGR02293 family)
MASQPAPASSSSSPDRGGPTSILRLQATSLAELRDAVRIGLPFSAALRSGFRNPTSNRRPQEEGATTQPPESDRLYRVARVVSQAVEVLGSIDKARVWLKTPNRALGCEMPLDLLDTEIGVRQVEEVLLRSTTGSSADARLADLPQALRRCSAGWPWRNAHLRTVAYEGTSHRLHRHLCCAGGAGSARPCRSANGSDRFKASRHRTP